MTCQPIDPKNMEVDSESENDPVWLRLKTQQVRMFHCNIKYYLKVNLIYIRMLYLAK